MAEIVNCIGGQWTKVATAITNGRAQRLDNNANLYYFASVATGSAAPTVIEDGKMMCGTLVDDGVDQLDLYIWPVGADSNIKITTL